MIYVDTSVALAHLLGEDRRPPPSFWNESLVASRLAQYELWNRIHQRGLARTHGDAASLLLAQISLVELTERVLNRALDPFPIPVATVDSLHLTTALFIREADPDIRIATYDAQLATCASAVGIPLWEAT